MNCPKGSHGTTGESIHAHFREVDGKTVVIAYICFTCRTEWWASKDFKERFGKSSDLYYDAETNSVKSDTKRMDQK